jgi:hypothetical protein
MNEVNETIDNAICESWIDLDRGIHVEVKKWFAERIADKCIDSVNDIVHGVVMQTSRRELKLEIENETNR